MQARADVPVPASPCPPSAARRPVAACPPSAARRLLATVRSAPLACTVAVAVLMAGAVTGTLLHAAADQSPLVRHLAYGLPALAAGRWFSLIGGTVLVPTPALYPVVALLLAVTVGFVERRAGAARTAAVLIVTQLAGALGAAGVLAAGAAMRWPWAHTLATHTDTGMSAGVVGVLAAGTALMTPVWRARVRWAVGGYLAVMLLRSGLLWDLEHAIGFAAGLATVPLLRPRGVRAVTARMPRLLRIRGAVALVVLVVPATSLVLAWYPGYGGVFGPGILQPAHPLIPALVELGIALVIAKALRRGLPGAWWAAVAFCAVPLGRDLEQATVGGLDQAWNAAAGRVGDIVVWAAAMALLIAARRCWPRRLPTVVIRRYAPRLLAATAVFAGAWWLVLTLAGPQLGVHPHERGRAILATATFAAGAHAQRPWVQFVVGLSGWVWAATLVVLLLPMVLSPREDQRDGAAASARLVELVRAHGGGSLGWQRTWPGFSCWTTRAGDVAISYRIVSGVALVLGDPVGPTDRWAAAVTEFRRFCLRAGWTVCWYAVTPAFAHHGGQGWHLTQIGEDAVLELAGLEFRGKSWQDVRTARNHARREGIRMQRVSIADAPPALRAQIAEVSRGWSRSKPLPEMGFTLGTVEHARDRQMRTHIAIDEAGTVHGVTTWLPVHAGGQVVGWTLDVMRRRIGGFRPVIEFLIAESALAFRAEGCRTVSLSVAPLARCAAAGSDPPGAGGGPDPLDTLLERASRMLEPAYGFRSLLEFKRKFHPAFSPVYLGYADEIDLSQITVAIGKAYLPHLTIAQAWRVVHTLCRSRRADRPDRSGATRPPDGPAAANPIGGSSVTDRSDRSALTDRPPDPAAGRRHAAAAGAGPARRYRRAQPDGSSPAPVTGTSTATAAVSGCRNSNVPVTGSPVAARIART